MLAEKISALKKDLVEYASLVEHMLRKSIAGLLQKEKSSLCEVIEQDEPKTNQWELSIDELCTNLTALYQPRAHDLRTILMIIKINKDLERSADHSVNIAESALFLIDRPAVKPFIDLPKMAEVTIRMLKDSIDSFIKEDVRLAKEVCERDDEVDNLREKILQELTMIMENDSQVIERALHLIRISGNLERIADLTTNICEDIIFMAEGRVITHHKEEA